MIKKTQRIFFCHSDDTVIPHASTMFSTLIQLCTITTELFQSGTECINGCKRLEQYETSFQLAPHIYFTFSTHKTLILATRSVCAFHSLHTEFFYSHISSEYLLFKLSHGVRKSCATGPRYKLFSAFFLRKTRIFTYFSAFLLIFHYFHTYFTAWRPQGASTGTFYLHFGLILC